MIYLKNTWENSALINSLRDMELPDSCSKCKYFQLCQGGCPATTYLETGKLAYPATDCPILKGTL